jgi:putative glycosyltransferase (TIGR04348 family)
MLIRMMCPAPSGSLYGNRVTALRWARILKSLGHRVIIADKYQGEGCDLLIALHARKSAGAVFKFHERYPDDPVIVALTGTDLYRDLGRSPSARRALEVADRIVALQPLAAAELESRLRNKVRVIYQSAERTPAAISRSPKFFDVCVVGHLRPVKDPFRAAYAARRLPPESRIRILHAGGAMEKSMTQKAKAEEAGNSRYRWLGTLTWARTRRLIAGSHLLVLSSRMEGGANVISEAVVDRTPIIASQIPGSVGLLGQNYPGYFRVGDTEALATLLRRAETDSRYYGRLRTHCTRLAPMFRPSQERERWRKLLREIAGVRSGKGPDASS